MQGKITKVLNMKPAEILGMVEEAAGTRMFEERKEKAVKTMAKKDKIHVQDFGDLSLHDQEVWVVNVELNRLEEVLQRLQGRLVSVEEVYRSQ
jgi:hypothetical protein